MSNEQKIFLRMSKSMAAEHVTGGHPDKICDQMADAILDAAIAQDPQARVAIEVTGGHGKVFVAGEMTAKANIDIESIVLRTYHEIGHADDIDVAVKVAKRSQDIADGVDTGGAGDQGIMVGYAVQKLVVDNYGPNVEIGGGAYSGKDPTKVDRSAAYMCRLVAKSIVASGIASKALVKVAYSIGIDRPSVLTVQTPFEPQQEARLTEKIRREFDFRPRAITDRLGLQHPDGWSYMETASFGHYGRRNFPWEHAV